MADTALALRDPSAEIIPFHANPRARGEKFVDCACFASSPHPLVCYSVIVDDCSGEYAEDVRRQVAHELVSDGLDSRFLFATCREAERQVMLLRAMFPELSIHVQRDPAEWHVADLEYLQLDLHRVQRPPTPSQRRSPRDRRARKSRLRLVP